ncbi:hypothetical protein CP533_4589 [Ophiocordyceps camponoti-saundersi (nom. inval.)]|nr:hypothetical protein CP533_4589 [Ophiocordyceps camponoti-saundersi (nom. inval.)]
MRQRLVNLALLVTATLHLVGATNVTTYLYLFELKEDADVQEFANTLKADFKAEIRRQLDYPLFKGVSVNLTNEFIPEKVAELPEVKGKWLVGTIYPEKDMPNNRYDGYSDFSSDSDEEEDGDNCQKEDGDNCQKEDGDNCQKEDDEQPSKSSATGIRGEALLERRASPDDEQQGLNSHFISMQIDQLHKKGITGKGSKIAIIDTGVDYTHPALGGCFGPGCVVSFGADLFRGEATPMEGSKYGDGTSVTGLIAARPGKLNYIGAAPGAEIGMYRVPFGSSYVVDAYIDALYRAHKDGATIVCSSLARLGDIAAGLLTEAVSRLTAQGVVVVQPTNNYGSNGLFSMSGPSGSSGIITVGGMKKHGIILVRPAGTYTVEDGEEVLFPLVSVFRKDNFTGTPMELFVVNYKMTPDDIPDLGNKVVLFQKHAGRMTLDAVAAKGARYVLTSKSHMHILRKYGRTPATIIGFDEIEDEVAESLFEASEAGRKVLITIFPQENMKAPLYYRDQDREPPSTDPFTFLDSSWGPSLDLGIQPSLVALGGGVLSLRTSPYSDSLAWRFASQTSSSFAAALVAAIVALVAEARGPQDPATMQKLLVSHAKPQSNMIPSFMDRGNYRPFAGYPLYAPVAKQGGGLVQAYDAAFSTTLLEMETIGLNFNDTEHFVPTLNFTIKNMGEGDVTYDLLHIPAYTIYAFDRIGSDSTKLIGGFDFPVYAEPKASLGLSERSLSISSKGSATISVTATAPPGLDPKRLALWSGWIAVNGTDGSSLSIPYQGSTGSIRQHRIMEPYGLEVEDIPGRDEFVPAFYCDLKGLELPTQGSTDRPPIRFRIRINFGYPLVHVDVVPVTTVNSTAGASSIGQVSGFPKNFYAERHAVSHLTNGGLATFEWTGLLNTGSYVQEGVEYTLIARALRIFGDPNNEEDWDVSKSSEFSVRYDGNGPTLVRRCSGLSA